MSVGLPQMVYSDNIRKYKTTKFGGYNHTDYAHDGEIYDERNMSPDKFPLLSPRKKRSLVYTPKDDCSIRSLFSDGEHLYWDDGTAIYCDGEYIAELQNTKAPLSYATINGDVVFFPEKTFYNPSDGVYDQPVIEWSGKANFCSMNLNGVLQMCAVIEATSREPGTNKYVNFQDYFAPGDSVVISGFDEDSTHAVNNKAAVIREVKGRTLYFDPGTFYLTDEENLTSLTVISQEITIKRNIPDLDFVFECNGRLWGAKGKTIYASKLGEPKNWNSFEGLSTDSYTVDMGGYEDFTGGCSYLGFPMFFKENSILKVYGDRPENFQVVESANLGVEKGSSKSLAAAGGILFYKSREGVMAYTGGIPTNISASFGTEKYINAVGGSDGSRYYFSAIPEHGNPCTFIYDTLKKIWRKDEEVYCNSFAYLNGLYHSQENYSVNGSTMEAGIYLENATGEIPENAVEEDTVYSYVEFADFIEDNPNKKGTSKIQMRVELEEESKLAVKLMYDSDGEWQTVKVFSSTKKKSFYIPITPKRNDHFRIRLEGEGMWTLYSLVRESYAGSEL